MSSVVEARRFTEESPEPNGFGADTIRSHCTFASEFMNMEEEEDEAMPDQDTEEDLDNVAREVETILSGRTSHISISGKPIDRPFFEEDSASVTAMDNNLDKRLRTLEEREQGEIMVETVASLDIDMDEPKLPDTQMSDLPFPGSPERLPPPPLPQKCQRQVNFHKEKVEVNGQEFIIEDVPDGWTVIQTRLVTRWWTVGHVAGTVFELYKLFAKLTQYIINLAHNDKGSVSNAVWQRI